jgi:hypothetical protein
MSLWFQFFIQALNGNVAATNEVVQKTNKIAKAVEMSTAIQEQILKKMDENAKAQTQINLEILNSLKRQWELQCVATVDTFVHD